MAAIGSIIIDPSSVELDNGENLKDLSVGDSVDLRPDTGFGGLWIVAKFDDARNSITLYNADTFTDCADSVADCPFRGTPHAHPVALDGRVLPRPAPAAGAALATR
jgi:hypothetical protein